MCSQLRRPAFPGSPLPKLQGEVIILGVGDEEKADTWFSRCIYLEHIALRQQSLPWYRHELIEGSRDFRRRHE